MHGCLSLGSAGVRNVLDSSRKQVAGAHWRAHTHLGDKDCHDIVKSCMSVLKRMHGTAATGGRPYKGFKAADWDENTSKKKFKNCTTLIIPTVRRIASLSAQLTAVLTRSSDTKLPREVFRARYSEWASGVDFHPHFLSNFFQCSKAESVAVQLPTSSLASALFCVRAGESKNVLAWVFLLELFFELICQMGDLASSGRLENSRCKVHNE